MSPGRRIPPGTPLGGVAVFAAPVVVVAAAVAVFVTVTVFVRGTFVRGTFVAAVVGVAVGHVTGVPPLLVQGVAVKVGVTGVAVFAGVLVAVQGVLVAAGGVVVGVSVAVLVAHGTALAVGAEARLYAPSPATIKAAMPSPSARCFMMALLTCLVVDASESFGRYAAS